MLTSSHMCLGSSVYISFFLYFEVIFWMLSVESGLMLKSFRNMTTIVVKMFPIAINAKIEERTITCQSVQFLVLVHIEEFISAIKLEDITK